MSSGYVTSKRLIWNPSSKDKVEKHCTDLAFIFYFNTKNNWFICSVKIIPCFHNIVVENFWFLQEHHSFLQVSEIIAACETSRKCKLMWLRFLLTEYFFWSFSASSRDDALLENFTFRNINWFCTLCKHSRTLLRPHVPWSRRPDETRKRRF